MSPFRLLTIVRLLTVVCCALACMFWCQAAWSVEKAAAVEQAAAEEQAANDKDAVADQAEAEEKEHNEKAPEANVIIVQKKVPLHELPARFVLPKAVPAKLPADKKQAQQQQAVKPEAERPNAPPKVRRRAGLSPAAAYRLGTMGRNVHLSPAMQFHLNRSRGSAVNVLPYARLPSTSAANVPRQGSQKFYPGVSQLPAQKPFTNIERPPTAFERYWPLLLEGRQDPNTGLIIWTLP